MDYPSFCGRQVDLLTMTNSVVMVENLIPNMLVIYVLIMTEQLPNNACKLIFILSVLDLMTGLFT